MLFNRDAQLLSLLFLLLTTVLWACGGVLLVAAVMRPPRRERLLSGLAAGLLLYISLSNALTPLLSTPAAFWAAALLIFGLGLGAAFVRKRELPLPGWADLPYAALLLGTLYGSFVINRGLSILDDYHNLPLVSVMAAGDIPPHFYLNPSFGFAYHYGLHVLAAAWVAIGGFTPWGAYDLSKAFTLALALPLAALWMRRTTSRLGWIAFGLAVFAFVGGTRWLLLLAPGRWLDTVSAHLTLLGSAAATGSSLHQNLLRAWLIEGDGPLPFSFAFLSGIRAPSIFSLGGSSLLPEVTLLALLLLHRRQWNLSSAILFAVLMSSLALSSELLFLVAFGALAAGLGLGMILHHWKGWDRPPIRLPLLILVLAGGIALVQGGVLTEIVRGWWGQLTGTSAPSYYFAGMSLAWPPHVVSAHLGSLLVSDPNQLVLSIIEAGPALLFLPLALVWSWQHLRRGMSFPGGLAPLSLALAIAGMVTQYESIRETSRLPGTAITVWIVFGLQPLILFFRGGRGWARLAFAGCLLAGMFAGVVLLSTELVAAAKPTRSYFVTREDALMADRYWNRMGPEDEVFDSIAFRAVTLFARPSFSYRTLWMPTGEYGRLVAEASPRQIAQAGFRYLYMDDRWWSTLSPSQQAGFVDGCAVTLDEVNGPDQTFRRLYDIRACADPE
jgi:hypothetical protein